MSSYNATIAKAIVDSGTGGEIVDCIGHTFPAISGAAAWAVEQAASHGSECAMPLVAQGAMRELMGTYSRVPATKPELKNKLKSAVKAIIRSCNTTAPLESFVSPGTPPELAKHLLARLVTLLQESPKARQQMVTSGALARLQKAIPGLDTKGRQHAEAINALFPPDVVSYYELPISGGRPAAGR
jgi:hypothetical protein